MGANAQTPGEVALDLSGIVKRYGQVTALSGVDLAVARGELLPILGPSGSGKTTMRTVVAGFEWPDEGAVRLAGREITHAPPAKRDIGMVFQNYALFPHMTVAANVAFPLEMRRVPRAAIAERVTRALAQVDLAGYEERLPRQLSGGQQQRVALARAIVFDPPLLLLDEPFGALDRKLREQMQIEVKHLQRRLGLTTLFVTHDQEEALVLSDRIAVMSQGRIEQLGSPVEIYDEPATLFVNNFIGSSNLLKGRVEAVWSEGYQVALEAGATWTLAAKGRFEVGAPVLVSVRPEQMVLADEPAPGRLPVSLKLSLPIGGALIHDVTAAGGEQLKVAVPRRPGTLAVQPGEAFAALAPHARPSLFPAASS